MRFRISTILWTTGAVAVFLAVCFLAPIAISLIVLSFTMCISPAVWISGASFGSGARRAFFVGGIAAGFVPHIITVYYFSVSVIGGLQGDWPPFRFDDSSEQLMARLMFMVCWLLPGVFAVAGGGVSVFTRWMVMSSSDPIAVEQTDKNPARPDSLDYQVISGRLSTVPFDQVAP